MSKSDDLLLELLEAIEENDLVHDNGVCNFCNQRTRWMHETNFEWTDDDLELHYDDCIYRLVREWKEGK